MIARYPKIRLYRTCDGERYLCIRESVSINLYMRCSHSEVIQAVLHALDVYRHAVGEAALGWYVTQEGDWAPLDKAGWALIRQQLLDPRGANVELRERPDAVTGYQFTYHGWQLDDLPFPRDRGVVCAVTFWLPTEYLETHGPERVRKLALELAAGLPFNSGHAGLSFDFSEDTVGLGKPVRELCFRYPGLDIPARERLPLTLGTQLKGAHWLTFLGPPVLDALGNVSGLGQRLTSASTTVQALEGGRAVVSLGEWPEAGDTEQDQVLPAYRELARVLEPWFHKFPGTWSGFSPEDVRRWERRFLE